MKSRRTKDVFGFLLKTYPWRSFSAIALLTLAGLAEGIGVTSLLPLLEIVLGRTAAGTDSLGGAILDVVRSMGVEPTIGILLTIVVIGITLKAALVGFAMRQVAYATADLGADLRIGLIRALMKARWRHFTDQPTGALGNALSGEATRASYVFLRSGNLLAATIQVVVYSVLAILVSWYVTVGAVLFGGVMAIALRFLVRIARQAGEQQTLMMSSLVDKLTDGLSSIKPLKAMAREGGLQPILEEETRELNLAQRRLAVSTAALVSLQEALLVLVLAIGVYFALTRFDIPFENLLFMALLFQRTANRIGELQSHYQQLVDVESALWSIQDATSKAVAEGEPTGGTEIPTLQEAIRFENVSFSYGVTKILDRATLTLPARKLTAVVGPSGKGKTTLVDLITGLLQPDAGEIWIDGTPLSRVDLKAWRSKIGYVPQEVLLLHDSIYVNVALKDPGITRSDVEAALRAAEAWDFVASFDDGLDGFVGERGSKLSGGQRQRIAIARALVREPDLLILDEATSGLDPATERSIAGTLRRLSTQITVVAVSHQPTLIAAAHEVVDLSDKTDKRLSQPSRPN